MTRFEDEDLALDEKKTLYSGWSQPIKYGKIPSNCRDLL